MYLVGGLEHEFYDFPYIGNFIIPTDELHHFSEGWLNHQPVLIFFSSYMPCHDNLEKGKDIPMD
jgi:hypothetical protein